jgi:hypothetical protein
MYIIDTIEMGFDIIIAIKIAIEYIIIYITR